MFRNIRTSDHHTIGQFVPHICRSVEMWTGMRNHLHTIHSDMHGRSLRESYMPADPIADIPLLVDSAFRAVAMEETR